MPSREDLWNIQFGELVYLIGLIVIVAAAYGLYRRFRLWRLGGKDERLSDLPSRVWGLLVKTGADGLWHRRVVRSPYAGGMHALIFGGFGLLLGGPSLDAIHTHVYHFLEGDVYLVFSLATDGGGLLLLVGIGMAAYRRYVIKPAKINNMLDDGVALGLLAVVVVSGFMVEGLRIAPPELDAHPGWAVWSPVGFVFAQAFHPLGENVNLTLHKELWWGHMLISMGTIAYIFVSFTRLSHMITSPLNMLLRTQGPRGVLQPIDLEAETIGVLA